MAFFGGKLRVQKQPDQIESELIGDDPGTQYQNIHVIVFHPLASGIAVMACGGPDSRNLVDRYRSAHPAAAYQNAPVSPVIDDRHCNGFRIIGIVYRGSTVGADVQNLMS